MKRKPRVGWVSGAVAIGLGRAPIAAAAAQGRLDVYLKNGNVWLSSLDGMQAYQLTFDGG